MNRTLCKIIRYASLAMAIIAGYSMAVSLIVYKFNFAAMPLYENLIILNSLLMLIVGIMGVRLYGRAGATNWFVKLSLAQAIVAAVCVAAVYVPNKMWSVSLFDVIYVMSAALSVTVTVCSIIARISGKTEQEGEV